jgi:chaperonin cofactor prefoldin
MADDTSALRELMEVKFKHLEKRIDDLRQAIEKMAETSIKTYQFESTVRKVDELRQMTKTLDDRIDDAESYIKIYRYVGMLLVSVVLAIVIAWLKGVLGV